MEAEQKILIVGGGTIGAGWAATFGAAGFSVQLLDPDEAVAQRLDMVWDKALAVLSQLGSVAVEPGRPVHITRPEQLDGETSFVQEALPERLELKCQILSRLEPLLPQDAIIASSSSGLSPTAMQGVLQRPDRFLIGHPCNPPYLMQVVEICGGKDTSEAALDRADAIYRGIGKTVLRLKREMPGHLVNRLQAALWREAVHMATEGVASIDDIEQAVCAGLAPRWCVTGPTAIFHMAGGDRGIAKFLDDLGEEMDRWWASLGTPTLDAQTRAALVAAIAESDALADPAALSRRRDRQVPDIIGRIREIDAAENTSTGKGSFSAS